MKLFTGSLAAGLVLLAGSAQAQVPRNGRLHGGIGFRRPLCGGTAPGSRAALRPGRATAMARACCRRRRSIPCCAITASRRSASRGSAASSTRLRCIDRGGEDGRLIIDARNGRIIRFMPAYRMGGDNYYEEQSALHGPSWEPPHACRPKPRRRTRSRPRRARHGRPRLRAARCRCRRPARSPPSLRRAPVQQAAAPAPKSAEVQAAAPADNRFGSGQARPADCTDPGHAEGAGAGVNAPIVAALPGYDKQKRPGFPGRFSLRQVAAIRADLRRPGSGRRPCPGCETSDRWPASSSIVVAFIRLARNRSRSGLMV